MSIKLMSEVWEHADAKGCQLLLLLALADYADDRGRSYPAIRTLANKTRMTRRGVQKALLELELRGLITVKAGAGPKGCHVFTLGRTARHGGANCETQKGRTGFAQSVIDPPEIQEENSRLLEKGKRFLTPGSQAHEEIST